MITMDNIVCFTQYFVNKQNVRSFSGILKSNIFKKDDALFFKHLLVEDDLVSNLTPEFISILTTLKSNLWNKSRNDFKEYFSCNKIKSELQSVNKHDIFVCCWKTMYEIIPEEFYGNNKNVKLVRQLIQTVIYSMRNQHFNFDNLLAKWNMSVSPWSNFPLRTAQIILLNITIWIIKHILSAMICLNFYVSTCKTDADENKLHYFWKQQWQSYYDKKIENLITTKTIVKYEPHSLTSNKKKSYSLSEKLKLRIIKKDTPKLNIILKPNNDFRPIVKYKTKTQTAAEKYKIKQRLHFLKILTRKAGPKIEVEFCALYRRWVDFGKPQVYFVKTDLSNAFGSIDRDKLMRILHENHLIYQKYEKDTNSKRKIAQQYKDMVSELKKPIFIRCGSTIFEWKKGLVQGYKYSPALSELYYTYLDQIYFGDHLKASTDQIKLFIRVVDDYLYITDSLEDAQSFLKALSSFRNVNYEKTVVNFNHSGIKYSEEIMFFGYNYNTLNWEVSRANNVYAGQICYKIAFTNALSNPYKFLDNRIGQSGIQVNGHIFNLIYNTEESMWKHVFTTFCLSANKFCTIYAIVCSKEDIKRCLLVYKKRVTVKLTNTIIDTLVRNKPSHVNFIYCVNHFRYLSWLALSLCAKNTPKCCDLVPLVNDQLAKTNCLFGKWNVHARNIARNGEPIKPAVKEVCRRTDFRVIFKSFNYLPNGFESYDHRIKQNF